jgi:hypothetical protein
MCWKHNVCSPTSAAPLPLHLHKTPPHSLSCSNSKYGKHNPATSRGTCRHTHTRTLTNERRSIEYSFSRLTTAPHGVVACLLIIMGKFPRWVHVIRQQRCHECFVESIAGCLIALVALTLHTSEQSTFPCCSLLAAIAIAIAVVTGPSNLHKRVCDVYCQAWPIGMMVFTVHFGFSLCHCSRCERNAT